MKELIEKAEALAKEIENFKPADEKASRAFLTVAAGAARHAGQVLAEHAKALEGRPKAGAELAE